MFKVIRTNKVNKNNAVFTFSVANENRVFGDITDDEETAIKFVELLNSNDVDEMHVEELIEDFFYC